MNVKLLIIISISILSSYGCSLSGQTVTTNEVPEETVTLVSQLIPTDTKPPESTATPTIIPTETTAPNPTLFVPFTASVWADNVNVRTNPGYLFPAIRLLVKGSNLTILGKAPGDEWMYVQTSDGKKGWVFTQLIESHVNLESVPVVEPQNVQLIQGRALDSVGTPIQGVGFAVVQGAGDKPPMNIVQTDASGNFYSFMPLTVNGQWVVNYNSIACKSNVWTDDSCSYYKVPYKGLVDPSSIAIFLPQTDVLEFTWK